MLVYDAVEALMKGCLAISFRSMSALNKVSSSPVSSSGVKLTRKPSHARGANIDDTLHESNVGISFS